MSYAEQPVIGYVTNTSDGETSFCFETDYGNMKTSYRWARASYHIDDIEVTQPRQQIGKLLLKTAYDHARYHAAITIEASIISRECLESMRTVFGPQAIEVRREGSYVSKTGEAVPMCERTDAHLYFQLGIDEIAP